MKYTDSEIYLNNPTLDPENQGDYQNEPLLQLGLLTSLPPAALWVLQRAKAIDRKRNVLYRIRDYERNVRLGTHFVKNAKSQKVINEARLVDEYFDYTKNLEELRAIESDPDADIEDIKKKREILETRARRLVQDIAQKPYSIYVNDGDRQAAELKENLIRDTEWEWLRSNEKSETSGDQSRYLENVKLIAEHREIVDVTRSEIAPENLTSSGQKALRTLHKAFQDSYGDGRYDIKVYKGSSGMYRFELTLKGSDIKINDARMKFELPAFEGSYKIEQELQRLGANGKLDDKLLNSFAVQDQFVIESQRQRRNPIYYTDYKDGKNNILLPSKIAYDPKGQFDSTINSVKSAVAEFLRSDKTEKDLVKLQLKANQYFSGFIGSDKISEAIERGYESPLSGAGMVIMPYNQGMDDEVAKITAFQQKENRVNKNAKTKSVKDMHTELMETAVARYTDSPFTIEGIPVDAKASLTSSSASGIPEKAKVKLIPSGYRVPGGHRQGQASLRTNLALGFNVNRVLENYSNTKDQYVGYFQRKKKVREYLRKLRRQHGGYKADREVTLASNEQKRFNKIVNLRKKMLSNLRRVKAESQSVSVDRYDLVNKRWNELVKTSTASGEEASFRVRRTIVTFGEDITKGFGVDRDQSLTISRYGSNFADLYNNPAVDLIQVGQSITYTSDHLITFDEQERTAISEREEKGRESHYKKIGSKDEPISSKYYRSVRSKIRHAERNGEYTLLLTKSEAEAFGVPLKEDMRVKTPRGSSVEFKEPHYVVVFEKRFTGDSSRLTQYKFGGSYNTKSVFNPTKESAKTTNALTHIDTVKSLSKRFDGVKNQADKRVAKEIAARVGSGFVDQITASDTLIGKGYSMQVADSIFTRVLSEAVTDQLSGYSSSAEAAISFKGQLASVFSGKQSLITINRFEAKGQSNLFNAAEDLFSRLVLGRERRKGEKVLSKIVVNKVEGTGEVTVSYKLDHSMERRMKNTQVSNELLVAIKNMEVEKFKQLNTRVNEIFENRGISTKRKDIFFGYIDGDSPEGTNYTNSVITLVEGDKKSGAKRNMFLDIMFGQGVAQGHNFYPDIGKASYGKNFYEGGPTFSYIEISGLASTNQAMSRMMQNMFAANLQKNYMHSHAMLQMNRHINSATLANQNEDAKRLAAAGRRAAKENQKFLKEITFMSKDAFLGGDSAYDLNNEIEKVRKTRLGDITVKDVLDKYRKINKSIPSGDKAKQLIKLIGLDEIYIDNVDEMTIKNYFDKKESVVGQLVPHSRLNVTGIDLVDEIRLSSLSDSVKGNPTTNLLWMSIPRPEDMGRKVTTSDLTKGLDSLSKDQRERTFEARARVLTRMERDGVVNAKVLTGTAQKQIQIETLNHINRLLKQAESEGASSDYVLELKEAMGLVRSSIENIANNYLEDESNLVGFGNAAQSQGKVSPGLSVSLNIQRNDTIDTAWSAITKQRGGEFHQDKLEWNSVLLNRKQVAEMASSRMVSSSRALKLISNPANKLASLMMGEEIGDLKKELGIMGNSSGPMKSLFDDLENELTTGRRETKAERYTKKRLAAMSNTLKKFKELGVDSWKQLLEASQDNSAKSIQNLKKMFSAEGFYKKISDKLSTTSAYNKDVGETWKIVSEQIEEMRRMNKHKKGVNIGRLGNAWSSIGKRLLDKTNWEGINSTLDEAISKGSSEEIEELKSLQASLRSARSNELYLQRKAKGIRKGSIKDQKYISTNIDKIYREFETKYGKNLQVLELMERANVDANELNEFMKTNGAASSQISSYVEVLDKRRQKLAKDFIGFEVLASRMQSMVSFSNEEELSKLSGMNDAQIRELAENKTKALLNMAVEMSERIKNHKSQEAIDFLNKIDLFTKELKGVRGELGFTKELITAYKFLKGTLTHGVLGTEGVDPNMLPNKHMSNIIIRSVLDKELKNIEGMSTGEKNSLLAFMKGDSAKVGAFFQSLLDRDFDGDRVKILANIVDTRWADNRLSMSVSNVIQTMSNGGYVLKDGRLTAANIITARTTEEMLDAKNKAKEMTLVNIKDYVRDQLKREYLQHGELESRSGESQSDWLERKYKQTIDTWIKENYSKDLTPQEREKLLESSYFRRDVEEIKDLENGKVLGIRLLKDGKLTNMQYDKSQAGEMTAEAFINRLLKRVGLDTESETYRSKTYNTVEGVNIIDKGKAFLEKFDKNTINQDASRYIDDINTIKGKDSKIFAVQKSLTGELYKYPMMMRAYAMALVDSGNGDLREVGKLFGEVATQGAAMFQQNLAIGIKKGGQLAGVGVKQLYQEMASIGMIQNETDRSNAVSALYKRIEEKGILSDVPEAELKAMRASGFASKMLKASGKDVQFGTLQLLSFGQAKQMAIQDLLEGKGNTNVSNYLSSKFDASASDIEDVSSKLIREVRKESIELRREMRKDGKFNRNAVLYKMYEDQLKSNSTTASTNESYIKFGKATIAISVELLHAAKRAGVSDDHRKIMGILGDVSKDPNNKDLLMDLLIKSDKHGLDKSGSIFKNFVTQMIADDPIAREDMNFIKSITQGRMGNYNKMEPGARKVHTLFSPNSTKNLAVAALGLLAVGSFAPDVTVGSGRQSYIEKRPEIESELPRKMLAQYSNQANVSYVPPWVKERMAAERREKASYNSMFFNSLTS